jgi:hypothetical protein
MRETTRSVISPKIKKRKISTSPDLLMANVTGTQ